MLRLGLQRRRWLQLRLHWLGPGRDLLDAVWAPPDVTDLWGRLLMKRELVSDSEPRAGLILSTHSLIAELGSGLALHCAGPTG